MKPKAAAKKILGDLPLTADIYWLLRQSEEPPTKNYYLDKLEKSLPIWVDQVKKSGAASKISGRKVAIFAALHYWISHTALLGTALSGLGHDVQLIYLPYARWDEPINRFDLRQQELYTQRVLGQANPIFQSASLSGGNGRSEDLPQAIQTVVEEISTRDTQYTLQMEIVDKESELYKLRMKRNTAAAKSALSWMKINYPDVVIIPNGSILEMGVFFQVARYLGIPTITYEFGEQRNRIWLAQNKEVMLQETDELWAASQDNPASVSEIEKLEEMFASRRKADLWQNFSRRWQVSPVHGGEQVRTSLKLDDRPVLLLAANVIGDSLTLGRQIFSGSMTEWLRRTVKYIAERSDLQLVVRIHPGERYTKGPSVAEVVQQALPSIPENIRLISADEQINTYDLVEIADLGLVYTTTVGLEMAMNGVPVIVVGQTHYGNKGFTFNPKSWEEYFELLDNLGKDQLFNQLTPEQVQLAWQYAYRFFFDYPAPFPWPMPRFWKELDEWPVDRVLSNEGLADYGDTFRYLVGEPRSWINS